MSIPFRFVQPRADLPWINSDGRPTLAMAQYMPQLDAVVRALAGGETGTLVNAANDTAAAAAGVKVGSVYRHGSQLMVRVS